MFFTDIESLNNSGTISSNNIAVQRCNFSSNNQIKIKSNQIINFRQHGP